MGIQLRVSRRACRASAVLGPVTKFGFIMRGDFGPFANRLERREA